MIVTFRSNAGPIEGFTNATFRSAINDEGIGQIEGPPDVIDAISGPIVCEVDGTEVFRWTPEERTVESQDDDRVTLSGRNRSAALERVIVLPVGYPAFTSRTRTETGAPFAIFSTLLAEAQGRGRVTDLTPTWTATEDSNGVPWAETISVQLEPGTHLRDLLEQFAEVETAEWIVRPNGDIDAAKELGADRSGEVVLFLGRDQVSRSRRSSNREQRQSIYIEASTGVSEANNAAGADAGEIWLEAQDYADNLSRQALADKLAEKLNSPTEEAEVEIGFDAGAFTRFFPGDRIGLDAGSGSPEKVRLVGLTVEVADAVTVQVSGTLITEVALRQRRIDRAIEAKADVQLAAAPVIQRRHGLVTADKFLSGAVGEQVAISSENYVAGQDGWAILGNGDAEFNDAVFRGDLQSDNYDPGVSGWALDRDGNAEFNGAVFRGDLESDNYLPDVSGWRLDQDGDAELNEGRFRGLIRGSAFTTDDGTGAGHIVISGNPALDPESPGVNQIAFIPDATFFPPGSYALPALIQVLDTGGMALGSVTGSSATDGAVLLLRTNGIDLDAGPNGFQGVGISAADGPIDLNPKVGLPVTVNGDLTVTGTTSLRATSTRNLSADGANRDISGYRDVTITGTFTGNGSGLTNLPIPPLPSDPTFNSVRVNTSLFFNTATFPRFEQSGTSVMLRGTGRLRMKFDGGLDMEDGDIRLGAGTAISTITRFGNANLQDITTGSLQTSIMFLPALFETGLSANLRRDTFAPFRVRLSTSSIRYKQDVTPAPVLDRLLDVEPVTFRGISEVQEHGDKAPVGYGAIAEWVHDLGLTHLVDYSDGRPNAVNYDRIGVGLIPHVRALRDRIDQLEEKINGT